LAGHTVVRLPRLHSEGAHKAIAPIRPSRLSLIRAAFCALAGVGVLASAPAALAVSGSPIHVGQPGTNEKPAIAVDASGTAYVVWANTRNGAAETIEYCVVPAGTSVCAHSGALVPGNKPPGGVSVGPVDVLVDGTTIVVLAETDGGEAEYDPVQEWTSTNGGSSFAGVNELKSVANPILSAVSTIIGDVVVPGTNALGTAAVTAGGEPTFDEFPFTSPPECSFSTCPAGEKAPRLQPEGTLEPLGNLGGVVASQLGTNPGVLAVYSALGAPGPAGCTFNTAYAYGSGPQEAKNSYDIAPGKPNSAWKVGLSPGGCEVDNPAVAGGPSGFGVVENDLKTGHIVYQAFDQADDKLDAPYSTIDSAEEEGQDSVSQDGAGGIYVTYLDGGVGTRLAYSNTAGSTWTGPATITSDTEENNLSSAVGSNGDGWATWTQNGSVYLQPFVASDAIPPAAPPPPPPPPTATTISTTQSGGGISGASLTVPQGTAVTDQAHIAGTSAAKATGTVTYTLYKNNRCTETVASSVESVVKGVAGASAAVKPGAGTYYWRAAYSGDAANDASASNCGSEILVVALNAKQLGLPSSHMCLSRRKFVVHPRAPKGVKLVSVEVQINGKFVKRGKLSKHATSISLVGLPKGTFKVALITTSSKGKIYEEVRTFHTCVPGKHKKKK
jgi:hypothetical protein